MKVFLSWSGDLSHKVACVFRDWMPSVIQVIRPYVSSEDIDKGTRWSSDIAQELEESTYGVLCITRENLSAPWINFEAGALSKTIEKSSVSPFLFQIKRSEVQGPLLQFQSTIYEKDDLAKLMQSINNRLEERDRLDDIQLRRSFEVWWPQLEEQLDTLSKQAEKVGADKPGRRDAPVREALGGYATILEELLELARSQQKLLRSPEDLLPPAYLNLALDQERRFLRERDPVTEKRWLSLHRMALHLEERVRVLQKEVESPLVSEIMTLAEELHTELHDVSPHRRLRGRAVALPKPTS